MRIVIFLLVCVYVGRLCANYENKIHYVWMGDLGTDQRKLMAGLGPERLYELLSRDNSSRNKNIDVNFWVRKSVVLSARELFSGKENFIKVKSIDDLIEKSNGLQSLNEHERIQLKDLVDKLNEKKMFASEVDILGQLVVAEFGGYYFDTTTYFKELPNFFDNQLEKRLGVNLNPGFDADLYRNLYPYHTVFDEGDLQVFSAPQRRDPVFISALKCIIANADDLLKEQAQILVPHNCLNQSMKDQYINDYPAGDQPPWKYFWYSSREEILGVSGEFKVYDELKLVKLAAGSWREGMGVVKGNINKRL